MTKALFITTKIELISKLEFATVVLDKNVKIFIVHIATLEIITPKVYHTLLLDQ